jgi:hypothetical protein
MDYGKLKMVLKLGAKKEGGGGGLSCYRELKPYYGTTVPTDERVRKIFKFDS